MTSNSDPNEFTTDDLPCAAFLLAHEIKLLRVDGPTGSGRRIFVFPASAGEKAAQFYRNAPAPARSLVRAMNDLRALAKRI